MPRKKFPKPEPLGRIQTYYGIVPVDVEIWANTADEGGRGSWKRRDASTALTILIETYTDRLLNELHPKGLKPKEIAELLEKKQSTVRKLLTSMTAKQQVNNHKGIYTYLSNTPAYIEYSSSSSGGDIGNNGSSSNSGNASSKVTLEKVQE